MLCACRFCSRNSYFICCAQAGSWEEEQILRGHEGPLTCLAFSLDGDSLVTGSTDRTARIWRMKPFLRGGSRGGIGDAVAAVGRGGVSGDESQKPDSGEGGAPQGGAWACMSVLKGHEGEVTSVCFSRDGRQLATGSADSSAKLWVVSEDGNCLGTVQVRRSGAWGQCR